MTAQREFELEREVQLSEPKTQSGQRVWVWLRKNKDDNLTTLLLALAALATSWSAYQASIWGGIQASYYTQANDTRTDALGAVQEASRLRMLDMALFANWLAAYAGGHVIVKQFYQSQFRPEFRPAFRAWELELKADLLANRSLHDTTIYKSPFQRPEYRVDAEEKAATLDQKASRLFQQGQVANDNSDSYVFDTVILAMVLFFASAARQVVSSRARVLIIVLSFVLLFWALVRISLSPVAG